MYKEFVLLHLSLIDQVGPATIEKLIAGLLKVSGFNFDQLYLINKNDLMHYSQLNESIAQRIVNGLKDRKILDEEISLINKHNIKVLSVLDKNYPVWLKEIYLPPTILYIKASDNFTFDPRAIAIVGSRQANHYGYRIINKLVPELIPNNFVIISGGAVGIDTHVADVTVNNNGKTIAVMGSGLLNLYPIINKILFRNITEIGALVSSFPLRTSALPGNFPARNRIIAGLSKACIVVQAAKKSGALITAQFALEQGKEVCAVPGPIDDPLSEGCHKLISEGAHLITCAKDILNVLGEKDSANIKTAVKAMNQPELQNLSILKPQEPLTIEAQILNLTQKALSFDELNLKLNYSSQDLQAILLNLQLEGLISQTFAGLWQKT